MEAKMITADRDAKLIELKQVILNKISNPINDGNKKTIIFSAFSNTAKYLYNNIAPKAKIKKETQRNRQIEMNIEIKKLEKQRKEKNKERIYNSYDLFK